MSFDLLVPRCLCLSLAFVFCSSPSLFAQFGWTFGEPTPLPVPINDEHGNADPTISNDGLTLIWASTRPGGSLWMSQRSSVDADWGDPVALPEVINDPRAFQRSPRLSANGLELFFGQGAGVGTDISEWNSYDLWVSKRKDVNADWEAPVKLGPGINSTAEDAYPSLSADGLELYFESNRNNSSQVEDVDVYVARRASLAESFETAERSSLSSTLGTPDLSSDGLFMFSSYCAGGCNLMISSRSSTLEAFGRPVRLSGSMNTSFSELAADLSSDGKTIYFYSDRPGVPTGEPLGEWGLWQAEVLTVPEPASTCLLAVGMLYCLGYRRRR